jgi:hypothetical protein
VYLSRTRTVLYAIVQVNAMKRARTGLLAPTQLTRVFDVRVFVRRLRTGTRQR